jgi:hypothetical protein
MHDWYDQQQENQPYGEEDNDSPPLHLPMNRLVHVVYHPVMENGCGSMAQLSHAAVEVTQKTNLAAIWPILGDAAFVT